MGVGRDAACTSCTCAFVPCGVVVQQLIVAAFVCTTVVVATKHAKLSCPNEHGLVVILHALQQRPRANHLT